MSELDCHALKDPLISVSNQIYPLVLGEGFRSKSQIDMLLRKLLESLGVNPDQISSILSFLCSESGSHDNSIHRCEARPLGLLY
jgi:hypothetical protein